MGKCRRFRSAHMATIVGVLAAVALIAVPAAAAKRPTCFGKRATIVGTNHRDHITGTENSNVIVGRGGRDVIDGNDGFDTICGGSGNDRLFDKDAPDKLIGGPGDDYLKDLNGADLLVGDNA